MKRQANTKKAQARKSKTPHKVSSQRKAVKPGLLIKGIKPQVTSPKKTAKQPETAARKYFRSHVWFAVIAVVVLLATTVYWSLLGARANLFNSDQLVDSYMFEDWQTFRAAHFPGAHTFFLKWPFFVLSAVFGNSRNAFLVATVAVALMTVLGLAWLTWRMMRRPLSWGMLMLVVSVVLLLIPIQPSATALLPVNMAMLTTRNLEYIVYILALVTVVRLPRLLSWRLLFPVALFGVLFLSDRLFLPLAVGSVGLMGVYAFFMRRPEARRTALIGVVSIAAGVILSVAAVPALNSVTTIAHANTTSPYEIASPKQILIGTSYSVLHVMTHLGINPASSAVVLRDWPKAAVESFRGVTGIAYLAVILASCVMAARVYVLFRQRNRKTKKKPLDTSWQLSLLLVFSSLSAWVSFVITDHYYAGDARYLSIVFFTAVVVAAAAFRDVTVKPRWARDWFAVAVVALISACYTGYLEYGSVQNAQAAYVAKTRSIVQVLKQRPVSRLIGDYWRVLPVREASGNRQAVWPLQSCAQPRDLLMSDAWRPRNRESFAYLLSLEKGQTDFPACTYDEVVKQFGRPNGTVVIEGTPDKPKEALLFYDRGAHQAGSRKASSTVRFGSVGLTDMSFSNCTKGTIMQIVAHPDDDLLFMNPDLIRSIDTGACIRTVYLTAADAGGAAYYWLGRQLGVEAAYSDMAGSHRSWQSQSVQLAGGQHATISSPRGDDRVALLFLNLPDGNQRGQGYAATQYASMQRLHGGLIHSIKSVDGQSVYTLADVESNLRQLFDFFEPTEVRFLAPHVPAQYVDHSDHNATGEIVREALSNYTPEWTEQARVVEYAGYPIHGAPENVHEGDLARKEAAFLRYAKHDDGVCQDRESCYENTVYGIYLTRQYTIDQYYAAFQ